MTRAATVTQSAIERAVRAVEKLGQPLAAVDVRPDGTVRLLIGQPVDVEGAGGSGGNEWDEVLVA